MRFSALVTGLWQGGRCGRNGLEQKLAAKGFAQGCNQLIQRFSIGVGAAGKIGQTARHAFCLGIAVVGVAFPREERPAHLETDDVNGRVKPACRKVGRQRAGLPAAGFLAVRHQYNRGRPRLIVERARGQPDCFGQGGAAGGLQRVHIVQ